MHDEQRVVDADGQPDHRDHVDDQEVEFERLADERRRSHGDDYGQDSLGDGNAGGDRRPEYEQQDHQRDWQGYDLTALQVLLGSLIERALDASVARRCHLEALVQVCRLYRLNQRLHGIGCLSRFPSECHGQQRSVSIPGYQALVPGFVVARSSLDGALEAAEIRQ